MPPRIVAHALAAVAVAALACLVAACGEPDDEGFTGRTCGDGRCEPADCETSVRCPDDCGACIGTGCDVAGSNGSCGDPCASSCECVSQAELCTATYGTLPGRCVPTDCLRCPNFDRCSFTPDAGGACQTVTCT